MPERQRGSIATRMCTCTRLCLSQTGAGCKYTFFGNCGEPKPPPRGWRCCAAGNSHFVPHAGFKQVSSCARYDPPSRKCILGFASALMRSRSFSRACKTKLLDGAIPLLSFCVLTQARVSCAKRKETAFSEQLLQGEDIEGHSKFQAKPVSTLTGSPRLRQSDLICSSDSTVKSPQL